MFSLFPFSEHKDTFLFKRMAKPMKVKSGLLEVFKMKPSSSSFSALRQRQQRQQWQWVDCLRRTLTFITSWYHILFLIFSNKLPSHIISYDNGLRLFVLSLSLFLSFSFSSHPRFLLMSPNLTFSVSLLPFSSPRCRCFITCLERGYLTPSVTAAASLYYCLLASSEILNPLIFNSVFSFFLYFFSKTVEWGIETK